MRQTYDGPLFLLIVAALLGITAALVLHLLTNGLRRVAPLVLEGAGALASALTVLAIFVSAAGALTLKIYWAAALWGVAGTLALLLGVVALVAHLHHRRGANRVSAFRHLMALTLAASTLHVCPYPI